MVRVGSLFDIARMSPEEKDNKTGMTAREQLSSIYNTIPGLIKLKEQIYFSAMSDLARCGIHERLYSDLNTSQQRFVNQYFKQSILPFLSPIIIGSNHPFPHLVNKRIYIAACLAGKKGKPVLGLVPIPDTLPAYLKLPEGESAFIRTENILLKWASTLFGNYQVRELCPICVTRNADISFDDEKFEDDEDDFRSRITMLLKKRDHLSVVRLEVNSAVSDEFKKILIKYVQVESHQMYVDPCPLNMDYVFGLAGDLLAEKAAALLYPIYQPRWPENFSRDHGIIEQIKIQDKLLFYPFDSVEPFLHLLSEAAEQPDVVSIKITIYRLASSSKIARILCQAAENGKEVIVLMELRARFDEANNVAWSKMLEEAGCQVIYGADGYKCHSKICLITLKERGRLHYITQIGTGNYNEKTNAMYTDLSLMTASDVIGEDATRFFRNMLVNNLEGDYCQLLVSPGGIKHGICDYIDEQIKKKTDGYICIKVNSITEREVIDKLMEASRAGVEVQLIVRGICCILPGVPTYTEHIHVTSIVGRYLEHARIYCFGKGDGAKLFISSADLMTRNLTRRVEIACPVYDHEIQEQLKWVLSCQLNDTSKASFMMSDGAYARKHGQPMTGVNSQDQFMEQSPHKPTQYIPPKRSLTGRIHVFVRNILNKNRHLNPPQNGESVC